MKRIILYILIFIFICFGIPIIFTNSKIQNVAKEITNNNEITPNTYDYKDYQTIKLLHSTTNQIEEIKLDEYLYGVVSSEMPAWRH